MFDLQTVSVMIAATGVTIAAIYYSLTVRNTQKIRELSLKAQEQALETRQAQLFMQIYSLRYSTDYFLKLYECLNREWTDYDDYMEKYGTPEALAKTLSVGAFFEGLGVIVKRGLLDPTLVDDLMRTNIIMWWEQREAFVKERRKRLNLPKIGEWSEYLYNEIKRLEEQQPELKT